MIVLDTNVVSEAMKREPRPAVYAWLNEQVAETLYVASVGLAELWYGVACLPPGRRKNTLSAALDGLLDLVGARVLPFDTNAAQAYARLAAQARLSGKGFPTADGYIAAIATANKFAVATRDTGPFEAAGVAVINPWEVG